MGAKANKLRSSAQMDPAPVLVREKGSPLVPTPIAANAEELDIDMLGCDTLFVFVKARLNAGSAVTDVFFEPELTGKDKTELFQWLALDPQVPAAGIQAIDVARKQYDIPLVKLPAENFRAFEIMVLAPSVRLLFWSNLLGHNSDEVEVFVQRVVKYNVAD